MANYNSSSQDLPDKQHNEEDQPSLDPLVNASAVSTVPGKQPEPILSMHVLQSIKKQIWAGEYIDLAYLLETNLVPEDETLHEFACTSNSTNKLSLTTAKPEVKIESDPAQCLPMVQYAAELNDNIGKFTFLVTYQYNMKFYLKK